MHICRKTTGACLWHKKLQTDVAGHSSTDRQTRSGRRLRKMILLFQTGSTTFFLVWSTNLNNQRERVGLSPPFDPTTIPVAKQPVLLCLNDCNPVTITPIVTKCFEWLVKWHITSHLLASLTEDKVYTTLHTALTHLGKHLCQNCSLWF